MKRWLLLGLMLLGACAAGPAGAVEVTSHGRFAKIMVYAPSGPVTQFVMLISGAAGWDAAMGANAQALADRGAMVAGITLAPFLAKLDAERACDAPVGDFENLSHHLQAFYKLPTYLTPLIAGRGSGASLAYLLASQAPPKTFGGLLTMGFCPHSPMRKQVCDRYQPDGKPAPKVDAMRPVATAPFAWQALPEANAACDEASAREFVEQLPGSRWMAPARGRWSLPAAFEQLAAANTARLPTPPADLADLPVIEVPAAAPGPRFALLLSGDGGWAGIDKELAAELAARGVSVAGFDSLRYFWTARTPAGLAADVDRLIAFYAHRWQRNDVLLIGYSQGADVLPFAINRLKPETRALVRMNVMLSLGQKAAFEFHVGNWLGASGEAPILPEAVKLEAATTLCVYGRDEKDALCPALKPAHARVVALKGGHHYDGDYAALAELILRNAPRAP